MCNNEKIKCDFVTILINYLHSQDIVLLDFQLHTIKFFYALRVVLKRTQAKTNECVIRFGLAVVW